jgi:hypothetical protein
MTWRRSAIIAAISAASSKSASAAGAAGSVVAAGALGLDLAPFCVGAFGATVVIALQPPRTRAVTWAHTVISVFFGGIGGPLLASVGNALAMHYLKTPDLNSNLAELMFAGLLSAGWPWAWPVVWGVLKKRIKGLEPEKKEGGNA